MHAQVYGNKGKTKLIRITYRVNKYRSVNVYLSDKNERSNIRLALSTFESYKRHTFTISFEYERNRKYRNRTPKARFSVILHPITENNLPTLVNFLRTLFNVQISIKGAAQSLVPAVVQRKPDFECHISDENRP